MIARHTRQAVNRGCVAPDPFGNAGSGWCSHQIKKKVKNDLSCFVLRLDYAELSVFQ